MAFPDLLREHTFAIRDSIHLLDKKLAEAEAKRLAIGETLKRQGTEITKQRAIENEKKRGLHLVSEKTSEARKQLEEIDKKRSEIIEQLLHYQEEESESEKLYKESQRATESLQDEINKEQRSFRDADSIPERLRKELIEQRVLLRKAIIGALHLQIKQQSENLEAAFSSQEKRIKDEEEVEAFRRARHSDPEIAKLCEQRDELRKFVSSSMVSGVKEMLADKIRAIEDQLNIRFPGAALIPDSAPKNIAIDDLLFFCSEKGEAIILLPFAQDDWKNLVQGSHTKENERNLCFIWSMIKGLGITSKNGEFSVVNGFPAFSSRFSEEEISSLRRFGVDYQTNEVLTLILTQVPSEVQGVLCHED